MKDINFDWHPIYHYLDMVFNTNVDLSAIRDPIDNKRIPITVSPCFIDSDFIASIIGVLRYLHDRGMTGFNKVDTFPKINLEFNHKDLVDSSLLVAISEGEWILLTVHDLLGSFIVKTTSNGLDDDYPRDKLIQDALIYIINKDFFAMS